MLSLLYRLGDQLWNPWLLSIFLLFGAYLSFRTGFFQLFRLPLWLKNTLGHLLTSSTPSGHGLSCVQALATALASTIGTGSIVGVATALTLGGPGAVFWLWLCSFFSMMISCIEKLLAVRYQCVGPDGLLQGGPMFYLRDGLHCPILADCFCFICLPATLTGGNLIQSSAIADAMEQSFGLSRLCTGVLVAALVGIIMLGGVHRIAKVSTILVPVMALLYLGSGLWVLLSHVQVLPHALTLIFRCALIPGSVPGAVAGWTILQSMRYGISRGVFTNEAGLGTCAIAHGTASVEHPARQGMWGIFEVFCSSFLVCTITALAILVSGIYPDSTLDGLALTNAAFKTTFPSHGPQIVSFTLLLFAFSSLLGWSYYGQQALRFLFGHDRFFCVYRVLFLLCIVVGSLWDSHFLWALVDLFNALLAIPNLLALFLLAPQALELLRHWEHLQQNKKRER